MNAPSRGVLSLHTEASGTAPPDAFGPFRVLHQIGAGTLGPVFRAYDSTRERLVAVKLFKLDLPPERGHQLVAEFERLIAAELIHPAIAVPLATGINGVHAFLAQEYIAADSLDLAVREYGPAPAGSALRVAAQLAGALDFAAAVHVTHGSLHPRDVLLSSDDTRLTGLGITHALAQIGVVAPVRRPYTPPERIAGGEWDRRADVFSLAAMMHELMWGRRVSGLGARAVEGLTPIPGADLSALRATFARALAERPDDRFPTALEFAEALKNACPDVVVAPAPAAAPKRRAATAREAAVREAEPRLPLEQAAEAEQTKISDVAPSAAAAADVMRPVEEVPEPPARFTDVEAGPAAPSVVEPEMAEPEIVRGVAPDPVPDLMPSPPPHEPPTAVPPGLITGHEPEPLSALERSRSAIWPIVLALVIGIALGFAGGYGVGWKEQSATPVVAVTPPAAPATPAREFTEAAVPATKPEPRTRTAEPAAQNPEARTPKPAPGTPNAAAATPKPETGNPRSQPAPGRLLVRSTPGGASVSVDGRDYGRTPAAVRDLAQGAHRVRIMHDGYTAEERRVVITASRPAQTISVELMRPLAAASAAAKPAAPERYTAALVVESRPAGAKVFVDGELVGATPLSLPSVAVGSHAVRLEHDGYRRWTSSVRVVASEQNRVTASLER
jgi:serine/threonine-protein kinase